VHDIHDLLLTGIKQLDLAEPQRDELKAQVYPLSEAVRESYRATKESPPFHEVVASAASGLDAANAIVRRNIGKLADVLARFPVARTRPFFT
jgi:pyruvate-ferredoxin/flavodoxin oxidoreductase